MGRNLTTTFKGARRFFIEQVGYYIALLLLAAVDYTAIVASVGIAMWIRDYIVIGILGQVDKVFYVPPIYQYLIVPVIFLLFIAYGGLYSKRLPFWQNAEVLFRMCLYVNALVILISYSVGTSKTISRLFMVVLWILSFFSLCLFRQFSKRLLLKLNLWQRRVIIVGAGKTAELVAQAFRNEPSVGYKIVGLIEDNYHERPLVREYPHIGTFDKLEEAIIRSKVKDIILATPGLEREKLISLMQRAQPYVRNVTIVPDLFGIPVANIEVETFVDDRLVMLRTRNNLELPVNKIVKRLFDLIVGSMIFICLIPVLLVLAASIKLDSKGPVLHVARRIGKNRKNFSCYKFRSMHVNSNLILKTYLANNSSAQKEWEDFAKLRDHDPRVTRVGRWMRRYSLDELPQILNVLIGNMSLVGPRPYLPRERTAMGYYIHTITQTVPGITGLWQVSGRNRIKFADRLRLDAWYVRNWSIWQDIVLLIKTIRVVWKKDGAY